MLCTAIPPREPFGAVCDPAQCFDVPGNNPQTVFCVGAVVPCSLQVNGECNITFPTNNINRTLTFQVQILNTTTSSMVAYGPPHDPLRFPCGTTPIPLLTGTVTVQCEVEAGVWGRDLSISMQACRDDGKCYVVSARTAGVFSFATPAIDPSSLHFFKPGAESGPNLQANKNFDELIAFTGRSMLAGQFADKVPEWQVTYSNGQLEPIACALTQDARPDEAVCRTSPGVHTTTTLTQL
jgi:hypothetical protein